MCSRLFGTLNNWPTKDQMASILNNAGLRVRVGQYSVRLDDCSHFVFQEYGGDLGDPSIDADADTVEEMMNDGALVSGALARAGIKHRFEVYDDGDRIAGYFHHAWPMQEERGA
jgi:hypothetical protein